MFWEARNRGEKTAITFRQEQLDLIAGARNLRVWSHFKVANCPKSAVKVPFTRILKIGLQFSHASLVSIWFWMLGSSSSFSVFWWFSFCVARVVFATQPLVVVWCQLVFVHFWKVQSPEGHVFLLCVLSLPCTNDSIFHFKHLKWGSEDGI